eukprot:m.28902 g.28902  ORF g.28902 m.28902 type:complete len:129 (+) comp11895_c0_seq1:174-560(+)
MSLLELDPDDVYQPSASVFDGHTPSLEEPWPASLNKFLPVELKTNNISMESTATATNTANAKSSSLKRPIAKREDPSEFDFKPPQAAPLQDRRKQRAKMKETTRKLQGSRKKSQASLDNITSSEFDFL